MRNKVMRKFPFFFWVKNIFNNDIAAIFSKFTSNLHFNIKVSNEKFKPRLNIEWALILMTYLRLILHNYFLNFIKSFLVLDKSI